MSSVIMETIEVGTHESYHETNPPLSESALYSQTERDHRKGKTLIGITNY